MGMFLRSFLKLFIIVVIINLLFLSRRSWYSLNLSVFVKCYSNVNWGVEILNFKWSLLTVLQFSLVYF